MGEVTPAVAGSAPRAGMVGDRTAVTRGVLREAMTRGMLGAAMTRGMPGAAARTTGMLGAAMTRGGVLEAAVAG